MKKLTFGEKAVSCFESLRFSGELLPGMEIVNPYQIEEFLNFTRNFYTKFFADTNDRIFVFGINPGRFGSGVTGIPFTDPVALQESCGIPNTLEKRRELSSQFVHTFIDHWGGAQKFFETFFLTAVYPLGFTRNGVNFNYYDDMDFYRSIKKFIVNAMVSQMQFGARTSSVIVFGSGKNQQIFRVLNEEYGFFDKVYVLEHPRYIMQYQRKNLSVYLEKYMQVFTDAAGGLK